MRRRAGRCRSTASGTFDSYNPFTFRGRATAPSTMMLERIMEPVSRRSLFPATACSARRWNIPKNWDWVIFNLRPEARFSDGTPLTAA